MSTSVREGSIDVLTNAGSSNGAVTVLQRDGNRDVIRASGTSIPADASSGYAVGCELILSNAVLGMASRWINIGTRTSSKFRPTGPQAGHGFFKAGGPVTSAGGDTTEVITVSDLITTTDISFVDHQTTNDTDTIVAQIVGTNAITITGSADPSTAHAYNYGVLRQGCTPSFDIVAAGTHVCVGGAAAEDITISGCLATDIAFATYAATDDSDVIAAVTPTAGKITVTTSADPGVTHSIHYCVLRPRGVSKPSHYVAYAGVHTTVGGAAAEAITVTGALATDVAIVHYAGTNDTDTIKKAVVTANTLTVTMSADPSTAHKLAYMILRAY